MTRQDLAIVGGEAVVGGDIVELNIGVSDGRVTMLTNEPIDAAETINARGLLVMPGVVDEHFHAFHGYGWETYEGATRGARPGRRDHDRRHAARQAADAHRRRAGDQARGDLRLTRTSTTRASAATWPRILTR